METQKNELKDAKPAVKTTEDEKPMFEQITEEELGALSTRGGRGSGANPAVSYKIVAKPSGKMPPQETAILRILLRGHSRVRPYVPEPEFLAAVKEAAKAGELGTVQNPWRIFQYYRGDLMERGIIAKIATPAAAPAAAPAVAANGAAKS